MAQDPLLVDQIQLESGSGDTLLLRRATDGSIEFFDAVITGGITLSELAGLQSVGGILVVGKSGAGAEYTTIQAAADAVPATSGPTEQYVLLIGPGVYAETVNLVRDHVFLLGLGGVSIQPVETTPNGAGAYHTVVIQADLGTIPHKVGLHNIQVTNNHDSYACVRVVGAASSEVGDTDTGIELVDCNLQADASGGNRTVWATSANYINVRKGSFTGSNALSLALVEECAGFTIEGTTDVTGLQLDYDTAGSLPSEAGSLYRISGCPGVGLSSTLSPPISSTLSGGGSLEILNCGTASDITVDGDQTATIVGTACGDLTLTTTTACSLLGSSTTSVTADPGASLEESFQTGTASLVGEATKAVTFPVAHPDTSYTVSLELEGDPSGNVPWISAKATTGFTINFGAVQTQTVTWSVYRG